MEKKLWKLICAGLAVIVVLVAALIVLGQQNTKTQTGVKVFMDREPADILELTVDNGYGSFTVSYDEEEDGYVFDDLPVNIVDTDGFFELMDHASGFGSLRMVKEHAQDLSVYGLDEPAAVISVTCSGEDPSEPGETFELAIGDKEKVSGNYYAQVLSDEEEGNVYLFAGEDLLCFLVPKEAYISDQVTPELVVSSPLSAVRDITFSGSALAQPVSITAVSGSDEETQLAAKSFGPATHIVRMEGSYELDQTYGIEILGSVLGIRALDVAGYNLTEEELEAMGFDDPYMQVDFSLKNGTDYIADYRLQLVPYGENYLAYMEGSGVVFVVSPPSFVALDPSRLCLRWFLSPLRTDLEDITVEFGDETYVFTSEEDEDGNILTYVNGAPMDKEQYFRFYRLVTGASSEGVFLTDPVNEGKPLMTITYHYAIDGKDPDVMKLYSGSLRRVNVEVNGVTEFDMRSSFVDAMENACHNAVSGEKIEENW